MFKFKCFIIPIFCLILLLSAFHNSVFAELINLKITSENDSISFRWQSSDCTSYYDTEITLEQNDLGYSETKTVGTCAGCGTGIGFFNLEMATQYKYAIKTYLNGGGSCGNYQGTILTKLGGTLESDRKLGASPGPGPYIVSSDLTIPDGITFTLENTEIQFIYKPSFELNLYVKGGSLNATSTIFTSAEQIKSAGQWDDIRIESGGAGYFKNCIVEYGKRGFGIAENSSLIFENSKLHHIRLDGINVNGNATIDNSIIDDIGNKGITLLLSGGSLIINDSTISNVISTAIYVSVSQADLNISNTYFYQNGDGIYLTGNISPNLTGNYFANSISGENRWAIQNMTGKLINANCCWWGESSGPYDESCNNEGKGDKVSECSLVDYTNWLTNFVPPAEQIACDFDFNKVISLQDAIIALKFVVGINVCNVHKKLDVSGDHKIGIEEVVYILQNLANAK